MEWHSRKFNITIIPFVFAEEARDYKTLEIEIEDYDYDNDDYNYTADPTFDLDIEPTYNNEDHIIEEDKPKSKERTSNKNRQMKKEKQIHTWVAVRLSINSFIMKFINFLGAFSGALFVT